MVLGLFPDAKPTLKEQLGEIARELKMRRSAYPRFVERGTITQATANLQVERLEAALGTLQKLYDGGAR